MKKLCFLTLGAALLLLQAGCGVHISRSSNGWSEADLPAVTNIVETAAIPSNLTDLDVDNTFGGVRVTGTETGPMRWTWKLTLRARTEAELQQMTANITCRTNLTGGRLGLAVTIPNLTQPHSIQSDFEITVPKTASARTQTRFGPTEIAQLSGNVDAFGQNGRVGIYQIAGRVKAETSFDSLNVSDTGPAVLKNQNGEIQAIRIGGSLDAGTSFASLLAQDIGGPAALVNQNGGVRAAGITGALGVRTSFDSISAQDIHGAASLTNQNGRVQANNIGGPLEVRTSFDSVTARDIAGRVFVRDQNGRVEIVRAKGDADIRTSFDRLSVEDIEGRAILENQNGEIEASGITGAVKADTSFASVNIKGAGPEFICHNQNGSIRLNSTSTTVTNIEANTSFDNIEVHLPAGLKPALVAHTSFGDIESDYPVIMKVPGQNAFADADPAALHAILQNQNGNIRVRRD
jgi:DUF4097 and DUF4098 domain-containing protein YvlB